MMIVYTIVLGLSAFVMAFGLTFLAARTARMLGRARLVPPGVIALGVVLALFIVVGAPWWLCVAFAALALVPRVVPAAPPLKLMLLIAAPLLAAPLLGASNGFAMDAVMLAAAVWGEHHAS